jgi:hypothetical protein
MADGDGWTPGTLKSHLTAIYDERDLRYQQRFDAQTKAVEAALLAAKEAVIKAELAMEKRFDGVNEFRETLSDQAAQFVTLAQFTELKERVDRSEGRSSGLNAGWGILLGAAALIGTVTTIILALSR